MTSFPFLMSKKFFINEHSSSLSRINDKQTMQNGSAKILYRPQTQQLKNSL